MMTPPSRGAGNLVHHPASCLLLAAVALPLLGGPGYHLRQLFANPIKWRPAGRRCTQSTP